jgi:hypothetical protein
MKRVEWGWCCHLKIKGETRMTGGTALWIFTESAVVMYYMNTDLCVILCEACYQKDNPIEPRPFSHRSSDIPEQC